ncbi:MAG: class I SAM-dependent methyltransferase [Candidatus Pacebacteria bacterium]|nr:class I SAM-dependent methyltransferase [Candidatus Paceibacterota bacterium]
MKNQNQMEKEIKIFYSKDWPLGSARDKTGYELLDTGEGEKLERFGKYTFVRPYEDAVWKKTLGSKEWAKADGKFWSSKVGAKAGWKMSKGTFDMKSKWEMEYKGIKFLVMPTPFRHLGFFPEQASHWDFIEEKIKGAQKENSEKNFLETAPSESKGQGTHTFLKNSFPNSPVKFLNLFGYTGVASLFALRAGAEVTHVDASKQILNWAKENQKLNAELAEASMRVIEDDALKFLEREEKRGNKYDAVIMDPPKFGRGPKGEVWKLEEMLPKLLLAVRKVLSEKPLFVILTSYAIDSSSLSLGYALEETMQDFKGNIEQGELCILEKSNNRIIPLANTTVWSV